MSLTAALRREYASNATGVRIREGVTLSHPAFSRQRHISPDPFAWAADDGDGRTITYHPAPIAITQPGQDESGMGRLPITFAAVPEVVAELIRAADNATLPMTMTLREYLDGNLVPEQVREFSLTGASIDTKAGTVSAVAALRVLTDAARWPRFLYRATGPKSFPGLDRK